LSVFQKQDMRKIFSIAVPAALVVVFSSCKKENNGACGLTPARIIRYDCDRVIFQLLAHESIGDSDWEDVNTGRRYSNVVSYYNTCRIAAFTNGNFDTLYISVKKINENLFSPGCNQCLAISPNPPQTKIDIADISTEPCR